MDGHLLDIPPIWSYRTYKSKYSCSIIVDSVFDDIEKFVVERSKPNDIAIEVGVNRIIWQRSRNVSLQDNFRFDDLIRKNESNKKFEWPQSQKKTTMPRIKKFGWYIWSNSATFSVVRPELILINVSIWSSLRTAGTFLFFYIKRFTWEPREPLMNSAFSYGTITINGAQLLCFLYRYYFSSGNKRVSNDENASNFAPFCL